MVAFNSECKENHLRVNLFRNPLLIKVEADLKKKTFPRQFKN